MKKNLNYSVVVPVYNEEENVNNCYTELKRVMDSTNETYELIFVNDGSKDKSLSVLKLLAENDANVKIVSLSRNFGQYAALQAGFTYATGDAIINIDCDLQDPPYVILQLIAKYKEGYDTVLAKREKRDDDEKALKANFSKLFYKILNKFSPYSIPENAGDFRIFSSRVKDEILKMPEHDRFLRGENAYVGFKQTVITFKRNQREKGKSKYNIFKLARVAFSALIQNGNFLVMSLIYLTAFTLSLAFTLTLLFAILAIFRINVGMSAWLVPIILFCTSIILYASDILGLYAERIYTEEQGRATFIVDETFNF